MVQATQEFEFTTVFGYFVAIPALKAGSCNAAGRIGPCGASPVRRFESCFHRRHAAAMSSAYPGAEFEITGSHVKPDADASLATTMVQVEGTRELSPGSGISSYAVGAECRFDHGVLTQFHWTKGPFT